MRKDESLFQSIGEVIGTMEILRINRAAEVQGEAKAMNRKVQSKTKKKVAETLLKQENIIEQGQRLVAQWRSEFPEWDSSKISFGTDELGPYIGFEVNNKILRMDVKDFSGECNFGTAMGNREEDHLLKRLPTGDQMSASPEDNEWVEMLKLIPRDSSAIGVISVGKEIEKYIERFRKLCNLKPIDYWSSSKYFTDSARIWTIALDDYSNKSHNIISKCGVRLVH